MVTTRAAELVKLIILTIIPKTSTPFPLAAVSHIYKTKLKHVSVQQCHSETTTKKIHVVTHIRTVTTFNTGGTIRCGVIGQVGIVPKKIVVSNSQLAEP